MATSGSVSTNTISRSHFYVSWTQASQSIANNTTTINWVAGLYTGTSSAHDEFYRNAVKINSVVINGQTVYSNGTFSYVTSGGNNDLASGTLDIPHNADGTKSFSISISGWTYSNSNYSGEGSFTLTDIPRQANITNAPNFNDTQNPTITYSNPAGNSVTSLQACISLTGSTDDIAYRDISKTGTSYTFNLTQAERNVLLNATTSSNSRTVKFFVRTILGGNTFYSTQDVTFSVINANPTIASTTYKDTNSTTIGITQNNQIIIQNTSTTQFTFTNIASLKSASLTSVAVTINGVTKSSSLSGSSVASKTLNFGVINSSSNLNASIVVTDSRGNKSTYTKAITIWGWSLPTAIITCNRQNNFYSETDINVNADYSSLNNRNTITIQYQYKKTTASSWSALANLQDNVTTTFTIDNNYAWNIKVIVTDLLGSTTYNLFIDKGIPIVYFDRFNNSMGVNCFPKNQLSFEVGGKTIFDMIYPIGSIYISINNTNPSTMFGGTWEQIEDAFLLAAGDTYAGGSTGGNANHKHLTCFGFDGNSIYGYADNSGLPMYGSGVYNGNRIHVGITQDSGALRIASTQEASSMPPYLTVYMWKRVS